MPETKVIFYEPGDCTRYVMVLTQFEAGTTEALRLSIPNGGFILLIENMGVHLTHPSDGQLCESWLRGRWNKASFWTVKAACSFLKDRVEGLDVSLLTEDQGL